MKQRDKHFPGIKETFSTQKAHIKTKFRRSESNNKYRDVSGYLVFRPKNLTRADVQRQLAKNKRARKQLMRPKVEEMLIRQQPSHTSLQ